jgi:hypothetical protein
VKRSFQFIRFTSAVHASSPARHEHTSTPTNPLRPDPSAFRRAGITALMRSAVAHLVATVDRDYPERRAAATPPTSTASASILDFTTHGAWRRGIRMPPPRAAIDRFRSVRVDQI